MKQITYDEINDAMLADLESGVSPAEFSEQQGIDVDDFENNSTLSGSFKTGVLAGMTLTITILKNRGVLE